MSKATGLYSGIIRDEHGYAESSVLCSTPAEIFAWFKEHGLQGKTLKDKMIMQSSKHPNIIMRYIYEK